MLLKSKVLTLSFLSLIFFSSILLPIKAEAQVLEKDSLALIDLYNAMGGSQWTNINWLNGSVSEWSGVFVENERVIAVFITDQRAEGQIPASIGDLDSLFRLTIRRGTFGNGSTVPGNIPPEIGNLKKLERLILNDCFNGRDTTIPTELGGLESLKELYLQGLKLNTPIPGSLGNLVNLELLFLDRNELSQNIPTELGSAIALTRLDLSNNNFEEFPLGITEMDFLVALNLERNNISAIPPEIANMDNLGSINMRMNNLSGQLPDELWNTPKLGSLLFSDNNISGGITDAVLNAPQMQRIVVNNNNISSLSPKIDSLKNLRDFFVDNNPLLFSDLIPILSKARETFFLKYEASEDSMFFAAGQVATISETLLLDSATDFILLKGQDSIFLSTDENESPYRLDSKVVFDPITTEDVGMYQIITKHDSFPNLTLEGRQFEIRDGSNAITMTQILDQTKPKNNLIRNLGFSVTYIDGFTPTNQVVTVSSDNEALIAAEDFQIDVTSSGYNLSVTPKTDAFGTATIGVMVADGPFKDSISFNIEVLDIVLSTDEVLLSGFSLAPNPTGATATLTIDNSYTGAVQVNVLSMQGKLLGSMPLFKTGTSLTSTLPSILSPGAYLVEVIMDDVRMVERLVVE